MNKKIAIIGGGNLGTAIAEGLIASKFAKPADITITKRNISTLKPYEKKGIRISGSNSEAVKQSGIIILAVKPFQVQEVVEGIRKELSSSHILVSVLTGVTIKDLEEIVKKKMPLFRAMPNTAIAIRESMTCLSSSNATAEQVKYINDLFCT
ncbi:MAG: pyrroline-5-carboxylate reductase, partial [Chitinophagaceae bacterium]